MNGKRLWALPLLCGALCLLCGCDGMDYRRADSLLEKGDYDGARAIYTQLEEEGGYEDSAEMLKECDYQEADAACREGDYARALELYQGISKYKDAAEGKQRAEYGLACQQMESGDYETACAAFRGLSGYEQSNALAAECFAAIRSNVQVGDIISFGRYEPDGYKSYDIDPIPWRVLAKSGDYALLMSEYLVEKHKVFSELNVYWDDSDIRTWLNGYFYESSFTDEERKYIQPMVTARYMDQQWTPSEEELQEIRKEMSEEETEEMMEWLRTMEGTEDNVFFLSAEEVEGLLPEAEDRLALPGQDPDSSLKYEWWIRSIDTGKKTGRPAGIVDDEGEIKAADWSARYTVRNNLGVRPVICLRLSSEAGDAQDMSLFGFDVNVNYGKREKPRQPSGSGNSGSGNSGNSGNSGSSSGRCPACGGTGMIRFYYGSSDLEAILSGHDPYTLGTCPMCNGRG